MKRIILDSNIFFSALRSSKSKTRKRIFHSTDYYYAPNFLVVEVFKHKERILRNSNVSEEKTLEYLLNLLNRMRFINEENISTGSFVEAYRLCRDIDENDTPFVALSLEFDYLFWTRDEVLKAGLLKKGFDNFFEE